MTQNNIMSLSQSLTINREIICVTITLLKPNIENQILIKSSTRICYWQQKKHFPSPSWFSREILTCCVCVWPAHLKFLCWPIMPILVKSPANDTSLWLWYIWICCIPDSFVQCYTKDHICTIRRANNDVLLARLGKTMHFALSLTYLDCNDTK